MYLFRGVNAVAVFTWNYLHFQVSTIENTFAIVNVLVCIPLETTMLGVMQLDPYTLRLLNFCIGLIFTIALAISSRNNYSCPGARHWFSAMLFSTIGLFFLLTINVFSVKVSLICGYGILVLAHSYLWLGFREYTHTSCSRDRFIFVLAPLTSLIIFILFESSTSAVIRSQVVAIVLATLATMSLNLALRNRKSAETGRLFCAVTLLVLVMLLIVRILTVQQEGVTETAKNNLVLMLLWSVSLLGLGTSILLITTQWLQQRLFMKASYDALTGVYNRHALTEITETLELTSTLSSQVWSVAMIDIDHFKKVNDHFGHSLGDEVLKNVAKQLQQSIRRKDILARYGGEEFVVILPDTDLQNASVWAERVRQSIEKETISIEKSDINVTISLGLAATKKGVVSSVEETIKYADSALYSAKNSGRNQVCCYDTKN